MSKEARGLVSPYLSNGRQYKIPCLIGHWELYYQGYWDIYIYMYMRASINVGSPKWLVYKGKFRGTPISGNLHIIYNDIIKGNLSTK